MILIIIAIAIVIVIVFILFLIYLKFKRNAVIKAVMNSDDDVRDALSIWLSQGHQYL